MTERSLVLTGASGLLGRAVLEHFADFHRVVALVYSRMPAASPRPSIEYRKCDLRDSEATRTLISEVRPSVIIHCAAERRPDVCQNDQEATLQLNVASVRTLAAAAKELGAFFVYISTDYIFDGTSPPYAVDAVAKPLNIYGETKLAGERAVWETYPSAGVLRVPILYGKVETLGESAITVLADALRKARAAEKAREEVPEIAMDDWQQRYPTHCSDVGRVLRDIVDARFRDGVGVFGTWHYSGAEQTTKFAITKLMAKILDIKAIGEKVTPVQKPPPGATPRPQNAKLAVTLPAGAGQWDAIPFEKGLRDALEPFRGEF